MRYEVTKNDSCKFRWKDSNNKSWPYIAVKDAENLEIDMEKVIADIGSESDTNNSTLNFLGRVLFLKDYNNKKSLDKKTLGYIPCKDELDNVYYIRIIKKKSKIYFMIISLLLFMLIIVGFLFIFNQENKFDLEDNAISYQMPNGAKNKNPEEIMIPLYSDLIIKKGDDIVNGGLFNPEGNPCFFEFRIYLKETNKTLFQSKLVKPGTGIREFKLNEKLKPGEYEIGIAVLTSSLDNPKVRMNGGDMPGKLLVE